MEDDNYAKWNLRELYDHVYAHEEQLDTKGQNLLKRNVWLGFKVPIPLRYFTENMYEVMAGKKFIVVAGLKVPVEKFWKEEDRRKKALILLAESLDNDSPIEPKELDFS